ncbi:hypothetical protein FSP39_014607 [Pinctada imbricata]|uniref:Elongation of very long chain fatty acids protein n=1 Tax=Pinctada imbricata TaxID=66713 RepID=A0AA88Y148_PINIB|nr:hypothetical protein FSP39_014607 [Pinctada imbricata]
MKDRPALHFPKFMVIYNTSLVILSIYMFVEIIASAVYADYFTEKPLCCVYNSETPKNPKEMRITRVLYIYFLSKIVELMDTVMMVLRKKFDQVTFLHVLHHSSMLNIWWWVMVYIPGGQSWLSSSTNSFVHIVMYLYYALAAIPACRPYLWWKKYITKLQLSQFFIILYHTLQTGFTGCDFPMWSQILLTSYMLLLIVLFGNFYVQAYIKKKREYNRKLESSEKNGYISNGTNGRVSNGHHYKNGLPNGHSSDVLKKEN